MSGLWHGLVTSLSLPPDPPTTVTLSSFSAIGNELLGPVLILLVVAAAGMPGLFILFNHRMAKNYAKVKANSK